jgi:hypothetical protein
MTSILTWSCDEDRKPLDTASCSSNGEETQIQSTEEIPGTTWTGSAEQAWPQDMPVFTMAVSRTHQLEPLTLAEPSERNSPSVCFNAESRGPRR